MSKKPVLLLFYCLFFVACGTGFEKFAPPANSISGRGAKVHPKILTTNPANGASISPVTGANGTQIVVVFDMTMKTDKIPVINTFVRDIGTGNQIIWYTVANSGATFTWSSTNFLNDTVTIQLGWVRWPENNIIGFDFDNNSLVNLDDMTLENDQRFSFTVGWNPGRYKVVPTGQSTCFRYETVAPSRWVEEVGCHDTVDGQGGGVIGTQDYPAGQNGFTDPENSTYGPLLYGAAGGSPMGSRFRSDRNPLNIPTYSGTPNCKGNPGDSCYPYAADAITTLLWRTCSQGQYYAEEDWVGSGDKCTPPAGSDFTWGEAVNACSTLNTVGGGAGYAGRRDWRLPTIEELENLVDYGARITAFGWPSEPAPGYPEGPAISGYNQGQYPFDWVGAFPNTPITKGYWTATGIAATVSGATYYGDAYVVEFRKGSMGAGAGTGALLESSRRTSNRKKVRCVAGPMSPAPVPNFVASANSAGVAVSNSSTGFAAYNAAPGFSIASAIPDINGITTTLKLNVVNLPTDSGTLAPNGDAVYEPIIKAQLAQASRYCIELTAAPTCPTPALNIVSASVPSTPTDNTVTLTIASTPAMTGASYTVRMNDVFATKSPVPGPSGTLGSVSRPTNPVTFNGFAATTFNVNTAIATSATTVNLILSKVPNTAEATNAAAYCIQGSPTGPCVSSLAVTGAALNGRTVTLTTAAQGAGPYYVFIPGAPAVTTIGQHIVTDSVNKLIWQRCRHGVHDSPTCADDGDSSNDTLYWNDGMNYCNALNTRNYAGFASGWRAPTINELKSIANRALFGTLGYAIDTTLFPTPNVLAEDFASSTNYSLNGPNTGTTNPSYDRVWAFNFIAGFPSIGQKDNSSITNVGLKPAKKSFRCVRSIP